MSARVVSNACSIRSSPAAAASRSLAGRRIGVCANVRAVRVNDMIRNERSESAPGSTFGSCIGVLATASRMSSTLSKRRLTAGRLTPARRAICSRLSRWRPTSSRSSTHASITARSMDWSRGRARSITASRVSVMLCATDAGKARTGYRVCCSLSVLVFSVKPRVAAVRVRVAGVIGARGRPALSRSAIRGCGSAT